MAANSERYRSIQDRLTAYRNQKGPLQPVETTGQNTETSQVEKIMSDPVLQMEETSKTTTSLSPSIKAKTVHRKQSKKQSTEPGNTLQNITQDKEEAMPNKDTSSWLTFTLKCLLWCLLQGFFIEIQFGVAFFITSLFYFMYMFMKGGRRKPWELSAYSVFNKDCQRIEGTLGAEQFEQELRYGPTAVHR